MSNSHDNRADALGDTGLRQRAEQALRFTKNLATGTVGIYSAITPLTDLINRDSAVTEAELHQAIDGMFKALAKHPVNDQLRGLTNGLRQWNLLPNEQSTEALMGAMMNRFTKLTANVVPQEVTDEFWHFFNELASEPELSGLGEIGLDIGRILLNTYEPLIVDTLNQLKELRRSNDEKLRRAVGGVSVIRSDLVIFRRQIKALRHIRTFFQIPEDDFRAQADIVAQMVREFGPFFIKIAQVAAANSDFLPEEIAESLAVFQEDVEPMNASEVEQAFMESFQQRPERMYFGFDPEKPLKSGSIASVYTAYRPATPTDAGDQDQRVTNMVPVLLKVGRHNLEREFLIGKTVIKLFILTSQYWAPHSKLTPFLHSWLNQTDIFVEGFREELDFEAEADNQLRFRQRARFNPDWSVPDVYRGTRRIIEMELIENAESLNKAFANLPKRQSRKRRRRIARQYLHAMLTHMLVDREFHGDLHQGNIMVRAQRELFFIDWGNTVDLRDIWRPVLRYLAAVCRCDSEATAKSLIAMSPDPKQAGASQADIVAIAEKTFHQTGLAPVELRHALRILREGKTGIKKRIEVALNLLAHVSRQGIPVRGEYLHLSRSLSAMTGSFLGLYQGLSQRDMIQDALTVWFSFPAKASLSLALNKAADTAQSLDPKVTVFSNAEGSYRGDNSSTNRLTHA